MATSSPKSRLRTPAVLAAAVPALAACGGDAPEERPSLVLVSIDTLRADRLGCYGNGRGTTPELDRLAERGARFERVVAESPWTVPSHVTMLSGLHPETHGVDLPGERPGRATPLLAELLRGGGYATFGFTDGGFVSAEQGFDRGFLSFRDERLGFRANLDAAREVIERAPPERPLFVFVHTYDVHCPYEPSEPFAERFRSEGSVPIETAGRCGNPDYNEMELSEGERRFLADRYDAGVAEADAALGDFVRFLDGIGFLGRGYLVVTSDHGEELFEHGRIGHERSVHREVLEVPLLVAGPDVGPRVVRGTAGLADVAPTLLDLLDEPPPEGVDGESWAVRLRGGDAGAPDRERGILSALAWKERLFSWMRGDEHLIAAPEEGSLELYDLAGDPAEVRDLAGERPERARALAAEMEAARAALGPLRPVEEAEVPVDELGALGYGG